MSLPPLEYAVLRAVADKDWVMVGHVDETAARALVHRGYLEYKGNPNGRRQSGYSVTDGGRGALERDHPSPKAIAIALEPRRSGEWVIEVRGGADLIYEDVAWDRERLLRQAHDAITEHLAAHRE